MIFDGRKINFGEFVNINKKITHLPSGQDLELDIFIYRSNQEGKTILLCSGVHGEEVNGVEILRRFLELKKYRNLKIGNIIIIPVINIPGFNNFTRYLPDGKDLNRLFPGSKNGTLGSKLANFIFKEILPNVDLVIDYHTGSGMIYNSPQLRITANDEKALNYAKIFDTELTIFEKATKNSMRGSASKYNLPVLVFEGGEAMRIDEEIIKNALSSTMNIINHFNDETAEINTNTKFLHKSSWIRANNSGIFVPIIASGTLVIKNQILGKIHNPTNNISKNIKARKSGFVYGVDKFATVYEGDALFHIGEELKSEQQNN